MSKREDIAAKMRTAAGEFRKAAADPACEEKAAATLLKVAADYLMCAAYINELEDRLARFELASIRNQARAS
jgi:hypothetical protein